MNSERQNSQDTRSKVWLSTFSYWGYLNRTKQCLLALAFLRGLSYFSNWNSHLGY